MKKHLIILVLTIFYLIVLLAACAEKNTEAPVSEVQEPTAPETVAAAPDEPEQEPLPEMDVATEDSTSEQPSPGAAPVDWPEITEDGVDEALFLEHLDEETLTAVASELQALVDEEEAAERENPELVLTEGWTRVFDSEHYQNVLAMGDSAMKPLYWIIFKSPDAGLYEYICATALYELSGYDFTDGDGALTWVNSKEFLERFDEQILADRAR